MAEQHDADRAMDRTLQRSTSRWLPVIAGLVLLGGFARVVLVSDAKDRFDQTTLTWFAAAAGILLLQRAKLFKFGELEIELHELKEATKEANTVAAIADDMARVAVLPTEQRVLGEALVMPGIEENDPWKGAFGGKSVDAKAGRMLTAEVVPLRSEPGWFAISLMVKATSERTPLTGDVQFFIHQTFANDRPVVKVVNGCAQLRLKAWGAFTVGVLTDGGLHRLELDLAELATAPLEFRLL